MAARGMRDRRYRLRPQHRSDDLAIDLDETFTKNSRFPGTVKISSRHYILVGRRATFESRDKGNREGPTEMTFAPMDPDVYPDDLEILVPGELAGTEPTTSSMTRGRNGPDAVIVLKEERVRFSFIMPLTFTKLSYAVGQYLSRLSQIRLPSVSSPTPFRSLLCMILTFAYASLVCTITWNNVEGLMNISHKLSAPSLQQECLTFLLKSAAGRPIKALRIAELFEEEELYREASRFVLDNPGAGQSMS
ncbi:BTB domain-containing protein [Salix suchowensis]|nr:BTB domain-containing protein [Salix suchowensis]